MLRGAEELRVKESDRIAAMAEGLTTLGVDTNEVLDDGIVIDGGTLGGGDIRTFMDHRIAMAFAVAGPARRPRRSRILDCDHVATSFPGFDALGGGARSADRRRRRELMRERGARSSPLTDPQRRRQGHDQPLAGRGTRLAPAGFSGALYRVVGQACLIEGVELGRSSAAVTDGGQAPGCELHGADNGEVLVAYKGEDVSGAIRTEEGGAAPPR